MSTKGPQDDKNKREPRKGPRINKKKLDSFLASICEAAGMTGKKPRKEEEKGSTRPAVACQGACKDADWRSHLDVASGVLCVSAAWSKNKNAEKHRDVTVSISYINEDGKPDYSEMVLCDSEVRWLMEALWHAPIWE